LTGTYAWQVASGIAAGAADRVWGNTASLATGATDSHDLATGGTLTNGSIYFSDPQWTNYHNRLYRIRSL
jgi:hypothetical protein